MEVGHWLGQHWFELLQSVGIIGGLLFTAASMRIDARARRVSNLLTINRHHHAIWSHFYEEPRLRRVLRTHVDLGRFPVTEEEELFVLFLILHLSTAQEAIKQDMFSKPDGLQQDIREFFSLPIPKAVWEKIKPLQDVDFVKFIERGVNDA